MKYLKETTHSQFGIRIGSFCVSLLSKIVISIFLASFANALTNPIQITEGRFFMDRGITDFTNATLKSDSFAAVSWVSASSNSTWNVCEGPAGTIRCVLGDTFSVPAHEFVEIGFCGACNPPQFPKGSFTIGGQTYEDVYFSGQWRFSQSTITVSPHFFLPRRGKVQIQEPFSMTGDLEACRTQTKGTCRPENTLFNGAISGQGALIMTFEKRWLQDIYVQPFFYRTTIEYQFEPLKAATGETTGD